MARMVVIYRTPRDPAAFDEHYANVHVPMAKRLPGLRGYEVSRGHVVAVARGVEPYLVATLSFDDLAALRSAFATPEGRACAADRLLLAPGAGDSQMYLFDTAEL